MYLKTRLHLLILATLLPVLALGMAATGMLVEREIDAQRAAAFERTRALVTAIDSELQASISALQVLARSPALRDGDLERFRADAERALQARDGKWLNVLVSDAATATMLLNLRAPAGAALQKPADPDSILKAAQTGQPTVSKLAFGEVMRRKLFAVRVPAGGPGVATRYVVSAVIDRQLIQQLVDEQRGEGLAAVVDGALQFVARRPLGKDDATASESLRAAVLKPAPVWTPGTLADGREVYRTVQPSAVADWAVSVSLPRELVERSQRYVQALWIGLGLVLGLSLWLAWWLAQGIGKPIEALADAAPALGRGAALRLGEPGSIEEVRRLYDAMTQASARIREREASHDAAVDALRAADRAKDEFLAMLGHELRNPLSSLAHAGELLKRADARPELVGKVAAIVGRQVAQMTRLVDDLLQVGRVTAGKIELLRADVDLAAAVRQTHAAFESTGRLAAHRVVLGELQPAWISADPARLEQIVANLLDNALKYTPAGGMVRLEVERQGPEAVLRVSDSGQGMSAELTRRAFDLFVQGERPLSRQGGGLGIGLTLTRRLVLLHGGSITAESAGEGQGSVFTVRLPAVDTPPREAPAPAREAATARTVLVIEDNADAGDSMVALIATLGHRAQLAATGALGVAQAAALRPDLVLVDIGLPDMDGYEVAGRLRTEPATRDLLLVALTGYGTAEDRRRALAAGFDDHVAKPIEMARLEALLAAGAH